MLCRSLSLCLSPELCLVLLRSVKHLSLCACARVRSLWRIIDGNVLIERTDKFDNLCAPDKANKATSVQVISNPHLFGCYTNSP
jgi:hypothetical protein